MKNKTMIGLLSFVVLIMQSCAQKSVDFSGTLWSYCEEYQVITFQDITDFDWDIVYVDYESYQKGGLIKEKYDITGDFEELIYDYLFRVAFCKDGKLVYDAIMNSDIVFDSSIEIIYPNTELEVKWEIDEMEDWGEGGTEYVKILSVSIKK